jgi:hypothetical protein
VFNVLPPDEATAIRKTATRTHGATALVRRGEVLHFQNDTRVHVSSVSLRREGLMLRQKRDGSGGIYVWAERIEE